MLNIHLFATAQEAEEGLRKYPESLDRRYLPPRRARLMVEVYVDESSADKRKFHYTTHPQASSAQAPSLERLARFLQRSVILNQAIFDAKADPVVYSIQQQSASDQRSLTAEELERLQGAYFKA